MWREEDRHESINKCGHESAEEDIKMTKVSDHEWCADGRIKMQGVGFMRVVCGEGTAKKKEFEYCHGVPEPCLLCCTGAILHDSLEDEN